MNPIYFSVTVLSKIPIYSKYYDKMNMDNRKKSTFISIFFMILIQTELKFQNKMTSEIDA